MSQAKEGVRLMIVEDEAIVAADLEGCLGRLGYRTVGIADNGADALALARAQRPDIALVDIRLKGEMDGIELSRLLSRELHMPVVFVTAHADAATVARASLSEPFGYVVKPFDEQALRVAVEVATARSAAERRIRELERWLATTIQSIGDALIATDAAGNVSLMNKQAECLTGWRTEDALGRPLPEVFPLEVRERQQTTKELLAQVMDKGAAVHLHGDAWLRTRSGTCTPIDDSIAPIRDERGLITGLVVVFGDRTTVLAEERERRKLEARMHETQRLESLGLVAGGVAHDFNNLLTVTMGNAQLCRARLPADSPVAEYLRNIEVAARRGSALCAQMLAYAGKATPSLAPLDIADLVRESAQLLRVSVGKQAELVLDLTEHATVVEADASQVQQILMNLVINAAEALPDGCGTITLRTAVVDLNEEQVGQLQPEHSAKPGRFVLVEVSDTGQGIDPVTVRKMFDPFFTTKFHGRGLGLAAVLGILQSHGGGARVVSAPGAGTVFSVYLPASVQPHVQADCPQIAARRESGRALVVDDEDSVRRTVAELLTQRGLEVDAFPDGDQAAAAVREDPSRYRLALVDLTMPRVDGVQTFTRLREVCPELPIVLMSGFDESRARGRLPQGASAWFLAKPFSESDLALLISEVLREAAPRARTDTRAIYGATMH